VYNLLIHVPVWNFEDQNLLMLFHLYVSFNEFASSVSIEERFCSCCFGELSCAGSIDKPLSPGSFDNLFSGSSNDFEVVVLYFPHPALLMKNYCV